VIRDWEDVNTNDPNNGRAVRNEPTDCRGPMAETQEALWHSFTQLQAGHS
jgi:hypothetical protein